MAEPAGLALGVIALASLFSNAVECFDFVQLGRAFEKDFKTAQFRLDICQLRFSRWGASLGLGRDLQPSEITSALFGTEDDVAWGRSLLTQILELLAHAESVSAKYGGGRRQSSSTAVAVCDPQANLSPSSFALHSDFRNTVKERRGKPSLKRRATWALHEGKRLRRLLEDIDDLVDKLQDAFPTSLAEQKRLCDEEAARIARSEELALLREIAQSQDKLLETALNKTLSRPQPSQYVTFSGAHNGGSQVGFNLGTMSNHFGKMT